MSEYDYFMVFALEDSGERIRLDINDPSQLGSILDPEQVFVIVWEEIRRIYIWKGAKSPVRKRFISSRVASQLQEELVKKAAFHRCKIVSIDQGDELEEFLNAFGLESMEVTETLADMRYIRNIDRQKMLDKGVIPQTGPKIVKVKKEKEKKTEELPTYAELEKESAIDIIPTPSKSKASEHKKISPYPYGSMEKPLPKKVPSSSISDGISENKRKEIIEKIIKTEIPENYQRQNLIIGHTLYGAVRKKVSVFGKEVEEIEWEPVKKLPDGMIEIENQKLRIFLDSKMGIVEGVEVLTLKQNDKSISKSKQKEKKEKSTEKIIKEEIPDLNSMTVKDLKNLAAEKNIELPTNAKKAEIINIIQEKLKEKTDTENNKPKRRNLPKIPSAR
ncbi:MAG: hypothetical protein ACTSQP_10460 [Promethearchaeota archaeon]